MNKWFFLAFTLILPWSASAGPRVVGNGGISIVCRAPDTNAITEAYLLDLFEAEVLGPPVLRNAMPVENQISQALLRLKETPGVAFEIQRVLRQIQSQTTFIKNPGVGLPLSDDALPILTKKGCKYEQVALYDSVTDRLLIDSEIFDSAFFSPTDRAALWLHEAIYKIDRLLKDAKNSRKSRELNAMLFTKSPLQNIVQIFNLNFERYILHPNDTVIWLDLNQDLQVHLVLKNAPKQGACSFSSLEVGDTTFNILPGKEIYENILFMPKLGDGNISLWLNGAPLQIYMQCYPESGTKGDFTKMTAEVTATQNGKPLLKMGFGSFNLDNISGVSRAQDLRVNDEKPSSVIFRYL